MAVVSAALPVQGVAEAVQMRTVLGRQLGVLQLVRDTMRDRQGGNGAGGKACDAADRGTAGAFCPTGVHTRQTSSAQKESAASVESPGHQPINPSDHPPIKPSALPVPLRMLPRQ